MPGDLYATADDLVLRLRADGADRWADMLNDAIESGSTGTEILMALRKRLEELLDAEETSERARELAANLKADINSSLRG